MLMQSVQNVWNSTTVESGTWDEEKRVYHVNIRRHGHVSTITAPHVVFATGAGSHTPVMPDLPGKVVTRLSPALNAPEADTDMQEKFKGTVLHSAEYKSASQWSGKTGIVVGTANTGT